MYFILSIIVCILFFVANYSDIEIIILSTTLFRKQKLYIVIFFKDFKDLLTFLCGRKGEGLYIRVMHSFNILGTLKLYVTF